MQAQAQAQAHAHAHTELLQLHQTEAMELSAALRAAQSDELILIADKISGLGVTDAQLHQQIGQRIHSEYKRYKEGEKNRKQLNRIGALMRAYASFGRVDSQRLLIALSAKHQAKPVRKRALGLLRDLDWYVRRNEIMQKPESYKSGQSLMTHRFLNLLASEDQAMRRWSLEEMYRQGGAEKEVYDEMEAILRREAATAKAGVHLDFLAWICKIFVHFDSRQRGRVLAQIRNGSFPSKLQRHAKLKS